MRNHLVPGFALLTGLFASPALAQPHGAAAPDIAKPNMVLQQIVEGLPKDDKQTVRVMTATFKPGGLHLMLMEPGAALKPGSKVAIEFTLKDGGKALGEFTAKKPGD